MTSGAGGGVVGLLGSPGSYRNVRPDGSHLLHICSVPTDVSRAFHIGVTHGASQAQVLLDLLLLILRPQRRVGPSPGVV